MWPRRCFNFSTISAKSLDCVLNFPKTASKLDRVLPMAGGCDKGPKVPECGRDQWLLPTDQDAEITLFARYLRGVGKWWDMS
jgi:hypothetical protein